MRPNLLPRLPLRPLSRLTRPMRLARLVLGLTLLTPALAQGTVVPALPPARSAPTVTPSVSPRSPSMPAMTPSAPSMPGMSAAYLQRGRQLTAQFYAQNLDPVWAAFLPEARASFGSLENFRAYRRAGVQTYGRETRVVSERVIVSDGLHYYLRTATFERGPQVDWVVTFGLDDRLNVARFGILGVEQAPQQTALLPAR